MGRIGILGGTFDPIHLGHLAVAEGACHLAGLDRVLFVPNFQPPHKSGRPVTPAPDRAAMVQMAIWDNPAFEFSGVELDRLGPSYTIDTVRELQAQFPGETLTLLIGMDSLLEIHTWYQYETLLSTVDILAFSRPGYPTQQRDMALAALAAAGSDLTRRIRLLELPGVDVSGTQLRRLVAAGYPLRYLVTDAVAEYIQDNDLYLEGPGAFPGGPPGTGAEP